MAAAMALTLAGAASAAFAQGHQNVGGWTRGAGGWRHEGGGGPQGGGAPGGGWGRGGEGGGWGRGGVGRGGPGPPEGGPPPWSRGPGGGYGRNAVPPRGRSSGGWDQHRYNGYWAGGRWYYGAPEPPAYGAPDFRPGFTPWRRGAYLPPAYQSYELEDYWRFHLRRPPYGYHWVAVGDEFLLVSMSTGLIFDAVTGAY